MNEHTDDTMYVVLRDHFGETPEGLADVPTQAAGRHRRPDDAPTVRIPKHRLRRRRRPPWRTVTQITMVLLALGVMGVLLGTALPSGPVNPPAPIIQATPSSRHTVVPSLFTSSSPSAPVVPVTQAPQAPEPPAPVEPEVTEAVRMPEPPIVCGRADGATLNRWLDLASEAIMAVGESGIVDREAVLILIRYESAGDPCAQNNWDINAQNGTPSQGIIQAIGPTFRRWALAGHLDPFHPVDSIIAGVRYARGRYGSESNAPGVLSVRRGGSYVPY